jgi:hypothetical protein
LGLFIDYADEVLMTRPGFQEAQSEFSAATSASFVGQVRRFGDHGPAYEVVAFKSPTDVEIVVIESCERLSYAVSDLLADPMAETVP